MAFMFSYAGSFNQPLDTWNVSSVTEMYNMFEGADLFDQNLGSWYITLNSTAIDPANFPGIVGAISAQNGYLRGQGPAYGIGTGGRLAPVQRDLRQTCST